MKFDRQAEWKSMPLEDWMAAIIDYRGKTPEKTSSGIPLITAKIVKGGRIADPEEFIAEEAYEQWMRRGIPEPGDVVLTTEAPLGEVAQLDERKVALAQRVITLRGKPGLLDNTYLKFAFQSSSLQEQLHGRASGSTVTGIKQSELRKLQLSFPSIQEQKRVAKILGSLDDKITVNRRINQTLEAMAQAIFKSWFIDFDPVKAKIAAKQGGRDPQRAAMSAISGRPDAELDTLPPEQFAQLAATAALFPDEMEVSALGGIPKGWVLDSLAKFCELNPANWSVRTLPDSVKYVDIANAKNGQVVEVQLLQGKDIPSRARRILALGDTIVGTVRPGNRSFALVGESGFTGSTGFAVLHPKADFLREFVYLAATSDENIKRLAHLADGGAYPAVRPELVIADLLPLPNDEVLQVFSLALASTFDQIFETSRTNKSLAEIRDTLLPKLLSGELSLPKAMAETEA